MPSCADESTDTSCVADLQEDEAPLAELLQHGQTALLQVGGRGGRGNTSFKTRLNTAPAFAERGEAGGEQWLDLELKVCAVWLVAVLQKPHSTDRRVQRLLVLHIISYHTSISLLQMLQYRTCRHLRPQQVCKQVRLTLSKPTSGVHIRPFMCRL